MARTKHMVSVTAIALAGLIAACDRAGPTSPVPSTISLQGRSELNASICTTITGIEQFKWGQTRLSIYCNGV
jgi:hypothetical protein